MRTQQLNQLRAAIAAVEEKTALGSFFAAKARSGWASPRREKTALGCFFGPGLHEWFGVSPPLGIFLHLARESLADRPVFWIGRRCRPYGQVLGPELLRRSIFVDPPDDASRLWAIDLAARCPAAALVIADGRRLDMAATRRLQLAAEAGSVPVLCARPPEEIKRLSAASTRWQVRCAPSTDKNPRWIVELLRCKGMRPEVRRTPGKGRWTMEWKRAQRDVVVHAELVDRPDHTSPQVRTA